MPVAGATRDFKMEKAVLFKSAGNVAFGNQGIAFLCQKIQRSEIFIGAAIAQQTNGKGFQLRPDHRKLDGLPGFKCDNHRIGTGLHLDEAVFFQAA